MAKIKRVLACKLTDAEVAERADLISAHTKLYVAIEDEKKQRAREFKERLDQVLGDIIRVTRQVDARAEERPVECEETYDLNRWCITTTRLDTMEVIGERNMTPDEQEKIRQMDLPHTDGSPAPAPTPKELALLSPPIEDADLG